MWAWKLNDAELIVFLYRNVPRIVPLMNAAKVFSICNTAILPCWLLLVFLPRWKWTQRVTTLVAPLLIAAVYAWLLLTAPKTAGAGFGSLEQVTLLFSQPAALTAGWIHYLAFDLFTGSWEVRDAQRLGISHWLVLPCLFLTFMFGPVGLALYLLLRLAMRKQWSAEERVGV